MKTKFVSVSLIVAASSVFAAEPAAPTTSYVGANWSMWENSASWSAGVPTSTTSAVFNSLSVNFTAKENAYVNDLYFYDGFELGLSGNYTLSIYKTLDVAGDFYYTSLRSLTWGGMRFSRSAEGAAISIAGNATFQASNLTDEQKNAGLNGILDVQVGQTASSNPLFSKIEVGGNVEVKASSQYTAAAHFNGETVNVNGIVSLQNNGSKAARLSLLRVSTNNAVYNTNVSFGGLDGNGNLALEAVKWGDTIASALTANITLKNSTDNTFTGSVMYTNVDVGSSVYTTSVTNLTLDAANAAASQTINLKNGSSAFGSVSVKNGTLNYYSPAVADSLTLSGGKFNAISSSSEIGTASFNSMNWNGGTLQIDLLENASDKLIIADSLSNSGGEIVLNFGVNSADLLSWIESSATGEVAFADIITYGDESISEDMVKVTGISSDIVCSLNFGETSLSATFSKVPEPAEWAAIFGALALAVAIRRRRK